MPALSEHSNVYNTVLLILQSKGYQVWFDEQGEDYCAERDGWDFRATTPSSLLGLVSVSEFKAPVEWKEYWWRIDGPDVYGAIPKAPLKPYVSVVSAKPQPPVPGARRGEP